MSIEIANMAGIFVSNGKKFIAIFVARLAPPQHSRCSSSNAMDPVQNHGRFLLGAIDSQDMHGVMRNAKTS